MNKKQIFLDMDGVLADFDKKKREAFGNIYDNYDGYADKEMWKKIHNLYPTWFYDLPPMEDAMLLWEFCKPHKPIILTAASKVQRLHDVIQQKVAWIHKHLKPMPPVIVCMRSHKKDYASTDAILVDDHKDNIDQFNLHGGVGILHKSAALSIVQLVDIV